MWTNAVSEAFVGVPLLAGSHAAAIPLAPAQQQLLGNLWARVRVGLDDGTPCLAAAYLALPSAACLAGRASYK